jgi:hypothetical protein
MTTWVIFTCGRDEPCLEIFIPTITNLYPDCNFFISEDAGDPIVGDYGLPKLVHQYGNTTSEVRNASILGTLRSAQELTQSDYVGKMDCDVAHFSRDWYNDVMQTQPGAVGFAAPMQGQRRYFYGMCYLIHKDVLSSIDNKGNFDRKNEVKEDYHMSERVNNVDPSLPVVVTNHNKLIYGGIANAVGNDLSKLKDTYEVLHCGETGDRFVAKDVANLMSRVLHKGK